MVSDSGRGAAPETRAKHAYFPYIDGLRAIAVIAVVIYHLQGTWLPGGFAGVDVFFVISGFVVSASLVSRERTSWPSFALYFLARRFQRIAPALVACLIATSLACALLIPEAWLSEGIEPTGRYAFFGLSNFILAQNANSYFSPIAEFNPYTHTWSLAVEEQFYLVFPLLFWMWTFKGRWRTVALCLFAALGAVAFGYALQLREVNALKAFYLLPSRFWELAAGVVLYQGMTLAGQRFDTADAGPVSHGKTALAALGLGLIGYSFITAIASQFPAPGAAYAVAGTAAVLGALHGQPGTSPIVRLLTLPVMRWLGRISYSLYLWHWPVFVLFRWTCGLDSPLKWISASLMAFLGAYLSWRFVENPVRRWPRLNALARWQVVALGAVLLVIGYKAHRSIDRHQHAWSLTAVERHADDWYPTRQHRDKTAPACTVSNPKSDALGAGYRVQFARTACAKPVDGPNVFALGDSHALAFGLMFEDYVTQTGAQVTLYNNAGCPFLSLLSTREATPACRDSAAKVLADIQEHAKPGDIVFLPSLRMPRFADSWTLYPRAQIIDSIFSDRATEERTHAADEAEATLRQLHSQGLRIVLEAPNLLLNAPAYRCVDPWTKSNPVCAQGTAVDRADFEQLRAPMLGAIQGLATKVPGTTVFDPFPILCPPGPTCDGYQDGRPLFFDGDHLSGYANHVLLPAFVDSMRDAAAQEPGT